MREGGATEIQNQWNEEKLWEEESFCERKTKPKVLFFIVALSLCGAD